MISWPISCNNMVMPSTLVVAEDAYHSVRRASNRQVPVLEQMVNNLCTYDLAIQSHAVDCVYLRMLRLLIRTLMVPTGEHDRCTWNHHLHTYINGYVHTTVIQMSTPVVTSAIQCQRHIDLRWDQAWWCAPIQRSMHPFDHLYVPSINVTHAFQHDEVNLP